MRAVVYSGPKDISVRKAYDNFDKRKSGWTKVVLKPGLS
jgi:threonine dehydrogenase-like Zn-dependent dehydrogenase